MDTNELAKDLAQQIFNDLMEPLKTEKNVKMVEVTLNGYLQLSGMLMTNCIVNIARALEGDMRQNMKKVHSETTMRLAEQIMEMIEQIESGELRPYKGE